MNIPTIILYNEKDEILNDECLEYFNRLKRFNIVHENPKNLAKFINENWNNLDDWWSNNELQRELKFFKRNYINTSKNKIFNTYKVL